MSFVENLAVRNSGVPPHGAHYYRECRVRFTLLLYLSLFRFPIVWSTATQFVGGAFSVVVFSKRTFGSFLT